jgi:hypothetical protein
MLSILPYVRVFCDVGFACGCQLPVNGRKPVTKLAAAVCLESVAVCVHFAAGAKLLPGSLERPRASCSCSTAGVATILTLKRKSTLTTFVGSCVAFECVVLCVHM